MRFYNTATGVNKAVSIPVYIPSKSIPELQQQQLIILEAGAIDGRDLYLDTMSRDSQQTAS